MGKSNASKACDQIEAERSKERTWVGPNGHGYLDPSRKCRVTSGSLGVFESVKCVEYFKGKGEKVPAGTPTYAAMEKEWAHRRSIKSKG